jgi:hypothetical protein
VTTSPMMMAVAALRKRRIMTLSKLTKDEFSGNRGAAGQRRRCDKIPQVVLQ